MTNRNILLEALDTINGPRRKSYGSPKSSFRKIASGWSEILGFEITAAQVAMCMMWLKICRESNAHTRDNIVDIAGYAALLDEIEGNT